MRILLKSKLYQQEILRWIVIFALCVWALITSALALQNKKEIILIGLDQKGFARVIKDKDDRFIQEEMKSFLQEFLTSFYSYDEKSFSSRISIATDLMSQDLWNSQKEKLLSVGEKLKSEPLTQSYEIESLDQVDESKIEAILKVKVTQRLSEKVLRLKVNLTLKAKERSSSNPWGYEIKELSDVVL